MKRLIIALMLLLIGGGMCMTQAQTTDTKVDKKAEKAKEITEDDAKKGTEQIQKITDKIMKDIDAVAANKEKEVMEV